MNVSVKRRTLIIGIGNPLRSDDGLGWVVAQRLAQEEDAASYDIHMVHQLTPELALWMSEASRVVLIDASHEGEPGALHVRMLTSSAQPSAVGTHYTTPEELAALAVAIYGYCAPVVVVTVTGAEFGMGEGLSAVVAPTVDVVCGVVGQMMNGV